MSDKQNKGTLHYSEIKSRNQLYCRFFSEKSKQSDWTANTRHEFLKLKDKYLVHVQIFISI